MNTSEVDKPLLMTVTLPLIWVCLKILKDSMYGLTLMDPNFQGILNQQKKVEINLIKSLNPAFYCIKVDKIASSNLQTSVAQKKINTFSKIFGLYKQPMAGIIY